MSSATGRAAQKLQNKSTDTRFEQTSATQLAHRRRDCCLTMMRTRTRQVDKERGNPHKRPVEEKHCKQPIICSVYVLLAIAVASLARATEPL